MSHGICSNYRYIQETGEEIYMESSEFVLSPTIFSMAKAKGICTLLATAKDKLRTLLGKDATNVISSERPDEWIVDTLGKAPHIYSLEVNAWIIKAACIAIRKYNPRFVYITTTDYAMHKFSPKDNESKVHLQMIDLAVGDIMRKYSNATIIISADHGMSDKTNLVDLGKILTNNGIQNYAFPIIKDRYVAHHSNLGGGYIIYLDEVIASQAIALLNKVPGVDLAVSREEAVNKFNLHADRIGQIVVTGNKETVFGNIGEVDMPKGLRSHGSEHEMDVPIIGYNLKNKEFKFSENRDVGKYVIQELGL
jgi:phosphonoacetate hydrolase